MPLGSNFRFYFQKNARVWSQELYNHIDYRPVRDNFHTFEADSCRAGLSFASVNEAKDFLGIVQSKAKFLERRASNMRSNNALAGPGRCMIHQDIPE